MKVTIFYLIIAFLVAGCESPRFLHASTPQQYQMPQAPIVPLVYEEENERWMSCAAGGIKSAISQGKIINTKVVTYPIVNRTRDQNLQEALDVEVSHAIRQLGLKPFPLSSQPHYEDLMDIEPGMLLQTEISVFDRTIRAAEAEKEFGINFGRGYGTGAVAAPSSERINHGAIRATTSIEKFIIQSTRSKKYSREVVQTYSSRANVFSKTTANGVDYFLLFQYGDSKVLKEVAGAQRALLTAARASIAGALLRNLGYNPSICGL